MREAWRARAGGLHRRAGDTQPKRLGIRLPAVLRAGNFRGCFLSNIQLSIILCYYFE